MFKSPLAPQFLALLAVVALLSGCGGGSRGYYHYRYIPGKTATVRRDGMAVAPSAAPAAVHAMIEAGNRIAGLPYRRGGGHGGSGRDTAYDCSGAASYVLRAGGKLNGSMPSKSFRNYGAPGRGEWVSVYARENHVFLVVAGLRFDTGWTNRPEGPQWTMASRPFKNTVVRHPSGM